MIPKRVFDAAVATIGLVLLSPFLAAVAAYVRVDSGPPIIFRHRRVGLNGVEFDVLKFRTMHAADGPELTIGTDLRITRAGRVLRRFKIDELPQLVNVVRGEMSLVGPRPEAVTVVARHPELFDEILRVRPGITDPASIAYRHEADLLAGVEDPEGHYERVILPDKVALSRQYLDGRTFVSDLGVIAKTVGTLFS